MVGLDSEIIIAGGGNVGVFLVPDVKNNPVLQRNSVTFLEIKITSLLFTSHFF